MAILHCDGDVPPIPPQAEREQVTDMLKALLSGVPDSMGIAARGLATKVQEFLPHRR